MVDQRVRERAEGSIQAVHKERKKYPREFKRGRDTLVITEAPEPLYNATGEAVGVGAYVKLYRHGKERPIDPHRLIVNPPTSVLVHRGRFNRRGEQEHAPEFKHAPFEALVEALWRSVDEAPRPSRANTRGTVTTVYATTGDGDVRSSNATYSSARSGSSLEAAAGNSVIRTGQSEFASLYSVYQGFLAFDTSAIPDGDDVHSVVLTVDVTSIGSGVDASGVVMEARQHAWLSSGLTTADWVAGASLSGLTLLATLASGDLVDDEPNSFTSEAAFLSATGMKTGNVEIMISADHQRTNNAPDNGTSETVLFRAAEASGTDADPRLIITHGDPPPAIDSITPMAVFEGESSDISGELFEATQNDGEVVLSPTDNVDDGDAVSQTVTAWADDAITVEWDFGTFAPGTSGSATAYVFVRNDAGGVSAPGYAITIKGPLPAPPTPISTVRLVLYP